MVSLGVDYGSVDENAPPNWQRAKAAGLRYVSVRATYGTWTDPHFVRDWRAIKAAGLVRQPYLFFRYDDPRKTPEMQVAVFAAVVGVLDVTDMPPCLDVEFPKGRAATGMSAAQALNWTERAVSELKRIYKVPPVIYTSARVWQEDLANLNPGPILGECSLWLAKPWPRGTHAQPDLQGAAGYMPTVPLPWPAQWFNYQFQGDSIGFPGFNKTVDVDRFRVFGAGAIGAHVAWCQRRLNLPDDGIFGLGTKAAVVAKQKAHGLDADGLIGPATWAVIAQSIPA